MPYEIFCESVQGAGHIKKGMPCEDYGTVFENDKCKVFALGDGHGDVNCPRSKIGSEYVCKIAVEEMSAFAETLVNQDWEDRLFVKAEAEELVSQLITSIFGKWSCAVNEEYVQNPLTDEESSAAVDYIDRYRKGERIEHIYGTTLIAGLLTDKYLLLLQQGDGRCVVFDNNGDASQPIPWDDRCFANITTSVCDTDAVQSCRYYVVDLAENPFVACFAGSDGVEDSFSNMDKMHTYYRELLEYACENQVSGLKSHLQNTLPDFSLNGSGDDTTICGILDLEKASELLEKFSTENEVINVQDEIQRAEERLVSMTDKLQHLKDKYDNAVKCYEDSKTKAEAILTEYKRIEEDLAKFEETVPPSNTGTKVSLDSADAFAESIKEIADNFKARVLSASSVHCLKMRLETLRSEKEIAEKALAELEEKVKAAEAEYFPYRDKYEEFQKKKEDALSRMNQLKGNE